MNQGNRLPSREELMRRAYQQEAMRLAQQRDPYAPTDRTPNQTMFYGTPTNPKQWRDGPE